MEYLDGEGAPAARDRIAAHLAGCPTCQTLAFEQRKLSDDARAWTVVPPPESLRAPHSHAGGRLLPFSWRWQTRTVMVTFSAVAAALVLFTLSSGALKRRTPAAAGKQMIQLSAPRASGAVGGVPDGVAGAVAGSIDRLQGQASILSAPESAAQAPRSPAVIRTASLRIVARDFSLARQTVEGIVAAELGFIDQLTVTGDTANARQLHGTLRVPGERIADTLARLRQIGVVTEDTQGSQDVTDQIVDLDARLASARATERRLTELLRNRTGKLSDVLDVERELARVRLDIERLDAEKTNVCRRVTYATVSVSIVEERKAGLEGGPLSLGTRLRLAALDGMENAIESAAAAVLFALRAGPTLALWAALGLSIYFIVRRREPTPRVSE